MRLVAAVLSFRDDTSMVLASAFTNLKKYHKFDRDALRQTSRCTFVEDREGSYM